jgi:hypothetical protein
MAVGQIKDYDLMESQLNESGFGSLVLLLGRRPTESALRYLAREGIDVAWPVSDGWAATDRLKNQLDGYAWC